MYGIFRKGCSQPFVFMGETRYVSALYYDLELAEARKVCERMNANAGKELYEVRKVR